MPDYCALCYREQESQRIPIDSRRTNRAFFSTSCGNDLCKGPHHPAGDGPDAQRYIKWPTCTACAFSTCYWCSSDKVHRTRINEESDSDDEDHFESVRVMPPRFCPWASIACITWKAEGPWQVPECDANVCTNCLGPASCRALVRVVWIESGRTTRYLHKICGRCLRSLNQDSDRLQAAASGNERSEQWIFQIPTQEQLAGLPKAPRKKHSELKLCCAASIVRPCIQRSVCAAPFA